MADNNREDLTHVKIENISFNNDRVIIHTKGLVTLHGCTLNAGIYIFLYKSQNEPDFTYKTAEMIPSAINNKTINIINTSFNSDLHMYLLSGIRTINIIGSDFGGNLLFVAGNKSVDTVNSRHPTVLNISIINTTFTNYQTDHWAYGRVSIISMKTTHSIFTNSHILQHKGAGYFGVVIENTKFRRSTVLFRQVISVSMRNCEYEVSDNIYYDNVRISGNDHFRYYPEGIKQTIKLLICLSSHCEGYWPTVSIKNTVFTGSLNKQTKSVIKTEHVTLIMRNVTFDIYQKGTNRKRWYISHTSDWDGLLVKLINVNINATSLPSASSVAMVSDQVYLENFEISCPQGLAVINVSSNIEEQFSCEKQCPTDAYTFQAGSAAINGNKYYENSPYDIKYNRSEVHCQMYPLGAN